MFTVYWLIGAAVLLVLEIITVSLTSIWFAGGAVIAAIVSTFVDNVIIQVAVFVIVSVLLLLLTRPLAKKYINSKVEKTNADALIGRRCMVAETIDPENSTGKVVINGVEWTARPKDENSVFPKGSKVVICEIIGVRLIVEAEKTETDKAETSQPAEVKPAEEPVKETEKQDEEASVEEKAETVTESEEKAESEQSKEEITN